jgi:hypothetical protein
MVKKILDKTWGYAVGIISVVLMNTSQWEWGIALYFTLLAFIFGLHNRLLFKITWLTRKPRRLLHWWFGRKWYWAYRGGIVKVVIRERDHPTLWSAMEYRKWSDGKRGFNYFSASRDSFHRTKDEAIKALVTLRDYEADAIRTFHEGRCKR